MTTSSLPSPESPRVAVTAMQRVEDASSLDPIGNLVEALSAAVSRGKLEELLRGGPAGHALHPFLTDLPIGFWLSSVVLDLRGRQRDRAAADLLLELGLVSTLPAVVTGLAEWRGLSTRNQRTGSLHAALNVVATTLFAGSLAARAKGSRRAAVRLSVAATTVVSASGYLGGHLAIARKEGSRDPAFDESST
jgi:uncharacterized membrane protein